LGFRAVLSSSFADIFANNSTKNGFLTVRLSEDEVATVMKRAQEIDDYEVTVDLEKCEVRDERGFCASFPVDEFVRHCLLNGLDDIGLTLQHEAEITAYESAHPVGTSLKVS
jgi:3-isopropylmalate/(R)-2-methylmalate dehydratase small subunit